MVLVFSEEVTESWKDAGVPGIARVWYWAVLELVHIASIGFATRPIVIVPAICASLSALSLGAEVLLARAQAPGSGVGLLPLGSAIATVVIWPSITAALVSLAAVRICGRSAAVSLQLD
jgi:hypothetical protein